MSKVLISLPQQLLDDVDVFATVNSYNRSELIRFALRKLIDEAFKDVKDVKKDN